MKLVLYFLILIFGINLVKGCTSTQVYDIKTDRTTVTFDLVDRVDKLGSYGKAWWTSDNKHCHVKILKSHYPHCITHEVRHCFEGNWHEGRNSIENCYED